MAGGESPDGLVIVLPTGDDGKEKALSECAHMRNRLETGEDGPSAK